MDAHAWLHIEWNELASSRRSSEPPLRPPWPLLGLALSHTVVANSFRRIPDKSTPSSATMTTTSPRSTISGGSTKRRRRERKRRDGPAIGPKGIFV
uniref:Uncharacterized protein n=1 Tax=Oryza glumipatula TaxID=40148 RepID=A0A0D9ZIN4_9ORYZ